ncbi:PLK/PLK1 protein kinase [Kwoniella mangroviensis CBS 10435]|uniref:PLK/PLK1 protein kinase n=1 Tax=Kwoniella mangroviensis CBS 10435 TaxID=1331196 RepID=A0A1B9IWU8_9TREE|nr:PLK/PLK1 protein kinase [Kwoniella mangroviensis CBS 10435]
MVGTPVKKKEKEVPPSPPLIIQDQGKGARYDRVGFLGEGGFARVYEIQDAKNRRKAVKVINKNAITSKKNKTKLWAEIKLHQILVHPHIVRFEDCFEDSSNVYMVLELCENGSMMDLLRRRKRYTEPEARYYLVQLIAACQYMHQMNVIHRDLKLGNLFLDADMNVKVGDFGLAALIENPGDRKKTICGTPNYIAPEVLFDQDNGHSFEVDVWSIGVIMYTLLIGKPPFQTKDVKTIYKRIRENRYEFPADKEISHSAQDLISSILNPKPDERPPLDKILSHKWFLDGPFPAYIPASANDFAPDYRHISTSQSRRNFQALCQKSKIGVVPSLAPEVVSRPRAPLGPSILQQERDFKNAVQPDSPISALLTSARQPLVQASAPIKEPSLLRKLSAAGAASTLSPARKSALGREQYGEQEVEVLEPQRERGYENAVRERGLANQKARIVSEMAGERHRHKHHEQRLPSVSPKKAAPLGSATTLPRPPATASALTSSKTKDFKTSLFDVIGQNLANGLAMSQNEQGFRTPHIDPNPAPPNVFVVSWLDYCTKYGMGFAMTDGTVSVHFNDSTSLVLAPGKQHFDDIRPTASDDLSHHTRRSHSIDAYPSDLKNKVYLLKHFESYMLDKLFLEQPYTYDDVNLKTGMVFIVKYLRMKHVILFRLSNDVLQFNFYDHTKLILSQDGLVVSVIDRHSILRTWSLESLLQPIGDDANPKDKKRIEGVVHKVQYARDVLAKIKSHGMNKATDNKPGVNGVPVAAGTRAAVQREKEIMKPIR